MKKILCFGDSNTYGYNPNEQGERFSKNERWTGLLSKSLCNDYIIDEQGLNGRTTAFDDMSRSGLNGLTYINNLLSQNKDYDLIIIMLGTNDCKSYFNNNADTITSGLEKIIKCIYSFYTDNLPQILIISPIHIAENNTDPLFPLTQVKLSTELAEKYYTLSQKYNCHFLDASKYAKASYKDYVHMDANEHKKLSTAIEQKIKSIYNQ